MDVADWLRGLGLEQYEPTFRENEIDDKVLTRLTAEDLKDLGVTMVGHRRRLLDAIAALDAAGAGITPKGETPAAPSGSGASLQGDLLRSVPRGAERRQLTVMFCDLVGSTALSARLDPEEMQMVLRAYQNAVTGEIARVEGHVAKLMGDGVLAYFGWPKAHEDEAERAVRAGLAVVEVVKRLKSPSVEELACRVGIATGLVIVGDLVGVGAAQEEVVVGETPNLAARLQQLAAPGSVVIAEATHRLLRDRFDSENLGECMHKGLPEPIAAYRILAERPVESRFAASHGGAMLPMVGRDEELALLLRHWRDAVVSEGRAVLVVGEPGIGKSRLVRALRDAVAPDAAEVVLCQCSPFDTDRPLWPIIQQLAFAAGFAPGDDVTTKRSKLAALLRQAVDAVDEPLGVLAPLLGVPLDPDPLAALTPQERRTRSLEALATQLVGRAQRAPVLVLFEDVHWLDPTSLELVQRVLDVITSARVLLVLTSRPDGQPALGSWPHLTRLPLHRLGREAADRIVGNLAPTRAFRDEIRSEIVARTDGVPLFIEELTKAMLEATPTGRNIAVPATLQDSLLARLDRSPAMKAVAQIAACIGREFDHRLLAAVANLPPTELGAGLDTLVQSELIFRRGIPPKTTYTFKHSLVRDVAYQSLLKPRRRELHGKILEAFRSMGHDDALEIMAYHATQAEHSDAVELWLAAGIQAARRYANVEALRHFEQARALVNPSTSGADHLRLRILKAMGSPLFAVHGYAAPVVEETYQAAIELAERAGDESERFRALRGLWNCFYARAELDRSLRLAHELATLAEAKADPAWLAVAHRALGSVHLNRGELAAAGQALEAGVRLASESGPGVGIADYGESPRVICQEYLALVHLVCGEPDRALELVSNAVTIGEKLGHPFTLARTLTWAAVVRAYRREVEECMRLAQGGLAPSRAQNFVVWSASASILLAWSDALHGDTNAVARMHSGIVAWRSADIMLYLPMYMGLYADAALRIGQPQGVDDELADAERQARASGEMFAFPELLRLQGLLGVAAGNRQAGEERLQAAIEVAVAQGARLFELRAARDLARIWAERGERQKAAELLAPIYGWFTEGNDTPDLLEAKALLDELH